VKRSRRIRLVLIGGLSAGAFAGCQPAGPESAPITQNCVYANNYHVPGVGYYHAPFRNWYALPYNHYDPQTLRYFFGGTWGTAPHQSITNLSGPTSDAVMLAQAQRTDIPRGGFGGSSHTYWGVGS
jgi:hypothetical protein